jgi:hypothetical protein
MASANFRVDQVINMVFDERDGYLLSIMDEESEQDKEGRKADDLQSFLNTFSGGVNFNKDLFVATAQNLLISIKGMFIGRKSSC